MSYKITEEGNVATVHLDGEIDMDVTEKAKEISKSVLKVIMMAKLEQILIIE